MEENVVMMDEEVLTQNEEIREDNDFEETTDMAIPDDIQEAEERCMKQPIVALIVGGVVAGAAIGVGITKLAKMTSAKIKDKRAARAEAKKAKKNTEEEAVEDEAEEVDAHPEVPSEEAKNLLKPESQRKQTSRKPKGKAV